MVPSKLTGTIWLTYASSLPTPANPSPMRVSSCTSWSPFPSLNLFISLYDDSTHNIDLLCSKFAKYKMQQKMHKLKAGKTEAAEGSVALFSQKMKDKGKKRERRKHDLTNVTCYGCRKKGHLKHKCLDKKDKKGKGKETGKGKMSSKNSGPLGTLYTAMSKTALLANMKLTDLYYIDLGASDHLIPLKDKLHTYKEFASPIEITVADKGKIYAHGTRSLQVASSING